MKAMMLLSLTAGLSLVSTAQEQFHLSDYVNPDYRLRQLDLDLNLGGSNDFSNQKTEGDSYFYHDKNKQYPFQQ